MLVQAGSGSASPGGGAGPLAASLTPSPARVESPTPDVPSPAGPQKVPLRLVSLPRVHLSISAWHASTLWLHCWRHLLFYLVLLPSPGKAFGTNGHHLN